MERQTQNQNDDKSYWAHGLSLQRKGRIHSQSLAPIDGPITFSEVDLLRIARLHKEALILTLNIANYNVCRILVNQGSFEGPLACLRFQVDEFANKHFGKP